MKKTYITLSVLLCTITQAQSTILDMTTESSWDRPLGAYYKDFNNVLDPFIGVYVYEQEGIYFKIDLRKKIKNYNGRDYEDLIYGDYLYKVNGVEKVNTFPPGNSHGLELPDYDVSKVHEIYGNFILTGNDLGCDECDEDSVRLRVGFDEPGIRLIGRLELRKIEVNGQSAVKANLWWGVVNQIKKEGDPPTLPATVPGGTYIMYKQ